jgi:hypothetical protein
MEEMKMTIKLNDIHELNISINSDGSCIVDFLEAGRKLGPSEIWASLDDVIEEYC